MHKKQTHLLHNRDFSTETVKNVTHMLIKFILVSITLFLSALSVITNFVLENSRLLET